MAPSILTCLIALNVLISTWALQVTPNSGCASVCMDYTPADPSDPNVSNTYSSDIVCKDSDYTTTPEGTKYQACINCLQNSTASASGESDQAWFLYNVRFALNTCLFNTANSSDRVDTPCALSLVCDEYSYCTANGSAFTGHYFSVCQQCLRQNSDGSYLSNFMIALDAGCIQQPANQTLIGLNSTLFTPNQVGIVDPIVAAIAAAKGPHKVLTRGAIAGIAVAGAVVLLILVACMFVCTKKRRNAAYLRQLRSPMDPRFGAGNITAPQSGAYASKSPAFEDMYKSPPAAATPNHTESVRMMRAPKIRNFSFNRAPHDERPVEWEESKIELTSPANPRSPEPPCYSPIMEEEEEVPIPCPRTTPTSPQYTPPTRNSVYRGSTPVQPYTNPRTLTPQRFTPSPSGSSRTSTPPVPPITTRTSQPPRHLDISAPVVQVSTRFESDEDARRARERLYRHGFGGGDEKNPAGRGSPASASTAVSQEMWPGSF